MFEVRIHFFNEKVWVSLARSDEILTRLKMRSGENISERRKLQPAFEEWMDRVMTADWGMVRDQTGGIFQFGTRREAVFFLLTWGALFGDVT